MKFMYRVFKSKDYALFLLLTIAFILSVTIALILRLTKIYESETAQTSSPKEKTRITQVISKPTSVELILVGDVMLGRTVMAKSLDLRDPVYAFRKAREELIKSDIVFANLEAPFVYDCPRREAGFIFCANPDLVEGLVFAGVNVVTLANNHIQNYGSVGLDETVGLLGEKGILVTGLGDLAVIEVEDTIFGFLGFNFVSQEPTEENYQLISDSAEKVDVLVVGIHWGIEYTRKPTKAQKDWAKMVVDNGADVIAGHHSHWVQEIDYLGKNPVFYSLGNFIFDQMWSEETKKGLAVKLTFVEGEITKEEHLPTYMSSWAQPEFVASE